MRRRKFLTLLGGTAAAWPLPASAQQPDRVRRIGVMMLNAERDPEGQARISAFRRSFQELGWEEGRNVRIDYRWGVGDPDRARIAAGELVALAPHVILANGTPAVAALQPATSLIPIVFVVVTDPVGAGFVKSLAQPGANITGFSTFEPEIGGKWLELLRELSPGLKRIAGILDPGFRGFAALWHAIERLAPTLGLEVTSLAIRDAADDIDSAIGTFAESRRAG